MPHPTRAIDTRPILIVGAARSGTTLLQYMLRSHPDVSLPTSESHFFIPFYERQDEFGDLTQLKNIQHLLDEIYHAHRYFFDENMHGLNFNAIQLAAEIHHANITTIPNIISFIFQKNATAEGKTRWGDKTPYYALHLETLLEMFPNAQVVHLIRDGRDCALSMLERRWDLCIFNYYHAAYTWNKYVRAGKAFGKKHPDHYFEIRYEDILDQPDTSIKILCEYLDIDFNQSVINFGKSDGSGKTPLLQQPLQKNNQDKWKTKLSTQQRLTFEALASETLQGCGYAVLEPKPILSRIAWFINEVHIRLCQSYNKHFKS
ncbi:MAG: hypothetical protein COA75_01590 [Cellvibrionales bacterium]|nr:MAG: hypothetical protein COA75_01590 [Cellvibrionales bacterium]